MTRHHLSFRNFQAAILKATDELFKSKPWRGDDEEKFVKYERWLRKASDIYGVKPVALEIHPYGRLTYQQEPPTIILDKYSVTSLFYFFRAHLQYMQVARVTHDSTEAYDDAFGWATSLFYSVRPRLFRKAVRANRIMSMNAEDLLHPDTPISTCQNCEDAVFPMAGSALEEGAEGPQEVSWCHVYTGRRECALETEEPVFAVPVEA